MRLRKKPGINEALAACGDLVYLQPGPMMRGRWSEVFGNCRPIHAELGTGKGRFITGMAARYPEINFIGIEARAEVLYQAAKKVRDQGLNNVRLVLFDINYLADILAPGEVQQFYINFCDPWPKNRHAKRRLTHANFLAAYRALLPPGGKILFKTDNEKLFEFSLNSFADAGMRLSNITFDLHNSGITDNVMTEYEEKFSKLGMRIYRCEAAFI